MSLTYLHVIITSELSVVFAFVSLKSNLFPYQYLSKRNNKGWFVSQREKADIALEYSKFYNFVKTREC